MTKKDALTIAMTALTASSYQNPNWNENSADTIRKDIPVQEIKDTIEKMIAQLSKPRATSDEAKVRANAKRKEQTAQARNALMEKVLPVLREGLTHTQIGVTAKELYDLAKSNLPEDFSAAKVQYVLLHEMASEVVKEEAKGKANIYRLAE